MLLAELETVKPVEVKGRISQVKTMHSYELGKDFKKIEEKNLEIGKNSHEDSQSNQILSNKLKLAE